MSPEFQSATVRTAAAATLLAAVAGCSVFKTNEEAQAVINQRVVGSPAGAFFDRYGAAKRREQQADGTIEYAWISAITATPNSGYYGLDDRTCSLKIISGKDGRIISASILQDMPGRTSTSRCLEVFKPL